MILLKLNTSFHDINECFEANQLSINVNKTHYSPFTASNNNPLTEIKVACDKKQITSLSNLNLLEFILVIKGAGYTTLNRLVQN
jgi:hypothetical protein